MNFIQKIFFVLTLTFFGISLFSMTVGQIIPIEFADWRDMHIFYDIILRGLPIMILLTLVWTIRKKRSIRGNFIIGIVTALIAFGAYLSTIFLMFSFGFGAWVNEETIYENKDNPKQTINYQLWDIGAFGYGGQRTVKLTPFLGLWVVATKIDTTTIEKDKWTLVKRKGDIKFP